MKEKLIKQNVCEYIKIARKIVYNNDAASLLEIAKMVQIEANKTD